MAYYCFMDCEFTCDGRVTEENGETKFVKDRKRYGKNEKEELISAGFVIMDDEFKIVREYYRTVKPACNPELSEYCLLLTKLTQNEIDSSDSTPVVIDEIISILEKYSIKEIYCYGGNDAHSLKSTYFSLKKAGIKYSDIFILIKSIRNIQPCLTKCFKFGMSTPPSLSRLCDILSIEKDSSKLHNALYDAKILGIVYKSVFYRECEEHDNYMKYLESLE